MRILLDGAVGIGSISRSACLRRSSSNGAYMVDSEWKTYVIRFRSTTSSSFTTSWDGFAQMMGMLEHHTKMHRNGAGRCRSFAANSTTDALDLLLGGALSVLVRGCVMHLHA